MSYIKVIPSASITNDGILTASDWSTFNSKFTLPSLTSGSVLFSNGTTIAQDNTNFFWDNTNKRLGVGAAPATNVRLDVRAQGSLSTDIAFRVRNSADTYNIFQITGDSKGVFQIAGNSAPTNNSFHIMGDNERTVIEVGGLDTGGSRKRGFLTTSANNGISTFIGIDYGNITGAGSGSGHIEYGGAAKMNFANYGGNGWAFMRSTGGSLINSNTVFAIYNTNQQNGGGTLALGTTLGTTITSLPASTYGKNTFFIANGTAPSTTGADAFCIYSADIVAGNAAPHFRTENGSIIKLYQNAAVTTPQGIADALTNLGVLASSTISPTVQSVASAATVTPTFTNDLVKITAQAVGLTLAAPTGTAIDGKDLMIRIKDNGTAQTIVWTSGTGGYRAIGVTLPTTTVAGKTTYVGLIYNSDDSRWDAIGVTTET